MTAATAPAALDRGALDRAALDRADLDCADLGDAMHRLAAELYPICRSITGDGVRRTLEILGRLIPLTVHEVPSGTRVFDWTVPKEWNIRDAYVKDAAGARVIDFQRSNLHVMSYSTPVRTRLSLAELREHLFTLPEQPDWIPYRTSYYRETWGFCLSHRQLLGLEEGEYEVLIDSSLEDGHLTYGECCLPGDTADEVLITSHVCHPSLCNDNLSGLALAAQLARCLMEMPRRYSYRFLFIPGTIGSITWLARNPQAASRIKHGLVVACVGDAGPFRYKRSRRGDAEIDRVVAHVLEHTGVEHEIADFSPYGYDERQFCSPGFDLPVGRWTRSAEGGFPEYHTSADDLDLVRPAHLAESLVRTLEIVRVLEGNVRYLNENPRCEPQLGRRGLYPATGGAHPGADELSLLWVLNLSDGDHTLLDIAERSGRTFAAIRKAADALLIHGLLRELEAGPFSAEESAARRTAGRAIPAAVRRAPS